MAKTFTLLVAFMIVVSIGAEPTDAQEVTTKQPKPGTTKPPGPGTTKPPEPGTTKPPEPETTKPPEPGTTKPPEPETTKPPGPGTTKPPEPGTTKPPGPGTTKPPEPGTTKPPGPGTTKPPEPGTTKPPASTAEPLTTTTVPTTTESPNACVSNPCGGGSTCEPRAEQTFVCLCLPGESYNNEAQICQTSKDFPGHLALETLFEPSMSDKNSAKFKEIADKIIDETDKTFKKGTLKDKYSSCLVLELRRRSGKRASSESGDKVDASINIFFTSNAKITQKDVEAEMKNADQCETCVLKGSSFDPTSLCDSNACDKDTTKCESGDGSFTCSCQKDYIPTEFSDRICLACPSGEKADGSKCVPCSFGYTGLNCEDNRLLAVVIAASVLGGLLLIALIVIPIVAVKTKKKGSKKNKNEDIGKPYASHSFAKTPAVHNGVSSGYNGPAADVAAPTVIPRIPRATGGSNWDNRTNLEMAPSNSRQNLISSGKNAQWINDDEDDTFSFGQSRAQNNHYEQTRPQQNHYAQSPSVNPHAQRQGNSNPYFMSDDDRYGR